MITISKPLLILFIVFYFLICAVFLKVPISADIFAANKKVWLFLIIILLPGIFVLFALIALFDLIEKLFNDEVDDEETKEE